MPDADLATSAEAHAHLPNGTAAKRTPGQVLREARVRDSEAKRARVLEALNEMAATGEKITFGKLARTTQVSTWLDVCRGNARVHRGGDQEAARGGTA